LPVRLRALFRDQGINLPERHGVDGWIVPLPSTFVIDQAGIIAAAFVCADITEVADRRSVIEEVRRLDKRRI